MRNSAKAALAIRQRFIYEPLISSEHSLLIRLILDRYKILSRVTENVS